MNIATAFVSIRPKTDTFKRETEEAATSSAKSAGAVFAQVFGAAAFGAGLKRSIDAASDLNETVSKTKQIFDASAKQIESWAQDAAKNLGLSRKAAMDGAATFAVFGQAAGLAGQDLVGFSTDLVGLASDLASFNNTSPEQAIEAIGAALRGESEPIRQYAVLLDDATLKARAFQMGIFDGTGVLTQQQRVLAAQAEILAQTTTQQGDFARTAEGAANSQRTARAEMEDSAASLGQNFLPIYTRVVQIVGVLAEAFGSLPAPVQTAIVGLIGVTVLAGPMGTLAGGIKAVTTAVASLAPRMATLSLSMGAVGALVGVGAIAYGIYSGKKREAEERTRGLSDALKGEASAQNEALQALAENDEQVRSFLGAASRLGVSMSAVRSYMDNGTGAIAGQIETWKRLGGDSERATTRAFAAAKMLGEQYVQGAYDASTFQVRLNTGDQALNQITTSTSDFFTELVRLREEQQRSAAVQELVNDATGKTADTTDTAADAAQSQADAAKAQTEANELLARSLEPARTMMDEAAEAADALRDAIDRVFGASMDMEGASRALQAAADDLTKSFEDNGKTIDINTEKGRANREAIEQQVTSILDYGVAMVGAGKTTDEATEAVGFLTEGLRGQLRQAGLTEDQINEYLTTLGLTPENVTTSIELANDQVAKEKLQAILDDLGEIDAEHAAEIQALIDEGKFAEAQSRLRAIEARRSVPVDLVPGRGLSLNAGGSAASRVFLSANGGYFPAKPGGHLVNLAEAGQGEAVLPLERPSRLAEMLGDPRIGGPIAAAMGAGSAGGASGGGGVTTAVRPVVVQLMMNDRVVQEVMVSAERLKGGAR
jgi:hypothetical protein